MKGEFLWLLLEGSLLLSLLMLKSEECGSDLKWLFSNWGVTGWFWRETAMVRWILRGQQCSYLHYLLPDILQLTSYLDYFMVQHTFREANAAADCLASRKELSFDMFSTFPVVWASLLSSDVDGVLNFRHS